MCFDLFGCFRNGLIGAIFVCIDTICSYVDVCLFSSFPLPHHAYTVVLVIDQMNFILFVLNFILFYHVRLFLNSVKVNFRNIYLE